MSRRRAAGFPLACVLLLGGCAGAGAAPQDRAGLLVSDRPPPVGRGCRVASAPATLPRADEVVDSAGMVAALRDLAAVPRGGGYAVLSIDFDQNGWMARREVIEHDLEPALADSLRALAFHLRREWKAAQPGGVRLRVELAAAPRLRVGRQEVCEPYLLNPNRLGYLEGAALPRDGSLPVPIGPVAWLRVLVDEHGSVTGVEVEPLPRLRTEFPLLLLAHSLSFRPALVDGKPVPRWVRIPVPVR